MNGPAGFRSALRVLGIGAPAVPSQLLEPSLGGGASVRTPSIPIRRPRLVLRAGAAQIRVEVPPARCLIEPVAMPMRLQAAAATWVIGGAGARATLIQRPVPMALQIAGVPTAYVGAAPARGLVTDVDDDAIGLALLGLL